MVTLVQVGSESAKYKLPSRLYYYFLICEDINRVCELQELIIESLTNAKHAELFLFIRNDNKHFDEYRNERSTGCKIDASF